MSTPFVPRRLLEKAAMRGEPHLEPFRFLIKRDRDGRHRWYLYNASGTIVGMHTAGFSSELEAYNDVGHVREELAVAPVVGETEPRRAILELLDGRRSAQADPRQATGGER